MLLALMFGWMFIGTICFTWIGWTWLNYLTWICEDFGTLEKKIGLARFLDWLFCIMFKLFVILTCPKLLELFSKSVSLITLLCILLYFIGMKLWLIFLFTFYKWILELYNTGWLLWFCWIIFSPNKCSDFFKLLTSTGWFWILFIFVGLIVWVINLLGGLLNIPLLMNSGAPFVITLYYYFGGWWVGINKLLW